MEYISAEEFSRQPKEVQEVFIDWWKCENGDLFINEMEYKHHKSFLEIRCCFYEACKASKIPLLTEGQIRQFIEDKSEKIVNAEYLKGSGYCLVLIGNSESIPYVTLGEDLLQAYWKVALEIAREKVKV